MEDCSELQDLMKQADDIFMHHNKRKDSKPIYENALEMAEKGDNKLEMSYIKGKIALVDQDWDNALKLFDEVLAIDDSLILGWHYKGFAYGSMGKHMDALKCFDRVTQLNPEDAGAHFNKACIYSLMGDADLCMANLEKAILLNTEFLAFADMEHDFDNIRNDPRFMEMMQHF
jgi:tetratricopeptide (TPR) repeat protein